MQWFMNMKKSRRYVLCSLIAFYVGVVIVTLVFADLVLR